jgi:hypothetical protein
MIMCKNFKNLLLAGLLSAAGSGAFAASISVFATGAMPTSPLTSGTEVWTFSGSFSDALPDVLGPNPGGTFEFEAADLATLDFSINGTPINFLAPSALLDSRIVINSSANVFFTLFFDPADPFFGGGYANVGFAIAVAGGPYASDPEDLSTLTPISSASATTTFFYRPVGGSFASGGGTGTAWINTPAPIPLPATLGLSIAGLFSLAGIRKRRAAA